jgi:hypothetical protein
VQGKIQIGKKPKIVIGMVKNGKECCEDKRRAFRQNAGDVDHNVVLAQAGFRNATEQANTQTRFW